MDRSVGYGEVHWHGHVLSREDCHILEWVLELEGQRRKGSLIGHGAGRRRRDGLSWECALCQSKWNVVVSKSYFH